jgi:glutamine amidotransferase
MIAILKYNAGNIRSVLNAVNSLGYECMITDTKEDLISAEKVIIPGVGEAGTVMKRLREKGLDTLIPAMKQPVLGICLGLQLLCRYSEEGDTECLGIFNSDVKRLPPLDKVPHMGWNDFQSTGGDLLKGIIDRDNVYYVHSYYTGLSEYTTAVCNYIVPFSASLQKNNFYGTQFHPEKSGKTGLKILKNFLEL